MLGWAGRQPKGTGGEGASIDDKIFACCCSGAAESVGYSASAVAGMPWSRSRPATRREAVTSGTTEYRRCVQRYMGRPGLAEVSTADCKPVQSWPRQASRNRRGTQPVWLQWPLSRSRDGTSLRSHTYMSGSAGRDGIIPCPPCPRRPALCLMDGGKHAATQRQTEQADGRVFVLRRGGARHRILPIVLSRADAIGRSMTKTSPDNWHWLNGRAASRAQAAPAWRAYRDE